MPDPDYGPDAGTRLYKRCNAEFYYVGKIPCIRIGHPSLQRGMVLNGFIHGEQWEHLCRRYMRSTECSSSCGILCFLLDIINVFDI